MKTKILIQATSIRPARALTRICPQQTNLGIALLLALSLTTLHAQTAGSLDPAFAPDVTGSYVSGMAVQPDGKLVLAGNFSAVNGLTRNGIARLQASGTIESTATFNPGTGTGFFWTSSAAVQTDGKIIVAGQFIAVNGQPRNSIARLNANGTVESTATFNAGSGANGEVHSVALQADGKILIAGQFTTVNGQPRKGIARLNPNGTVESTATFNPGSGASTGGGTGLEAHVYSVAVQADGKILIGGDFVSVNGQPRNGIARLNSDGTVESTATFNPGTGAAGGGGVSPYVWSIAVQADGKILIGGNFTTVNGQPRNYLARLLTNGIVEDTATFNPGTGADSPIWSTVLQADGKILLGGQFTTMNGQPRNQLARLHPDGTVESTATFNTTPGPDDSWVAGLALQADGEILLAGFFTSVDGQQRHHIARLTNDVATQNLSIPSNTRVQWLRSGSTPEIEQVTFEISTNGAATWSLLGSGARINGGWELTGLSLTGSGVIRARGRTMSGAFGGSSGLVETVATFPVAPQIDIALVTTGIRLRFTGTPGIGYNIERAPAITGPWSINATATAPIGGIIELVDTNPPVSGALYRTRTP